MTLKANEVRAFVPSRDMDLSKQFYLDLGFVIPWSTDDLALLECGPAKFLLQRFYIAEHAGNYMISLLVDDADAWWRQVVERDLAARYGVLAEPPEDRPWGLRDFPLSDPTGVLWRVGHFLHRN